jgi:hypothetical protein
MLRLLLVVVPLVIGACGDTSSPTTPTKPAKREITPRAKLPVAIQPVVPKHGIYAAGGGLMSPPWRVVVDTDADTIYAGSSTQANAPSMDKLEKESTKPLTPANKQRLMDMASSVWTEPRPTTLDDPTADYDEILVVADGDDTFYLQGFGPIHRPLAAKLITELRAAGAL